MTRGLFHSLGRYGLKEATFFDDIAPFLDGGDLELLKRNSKAAFYEPLVGAAGSRAGGGARSRPPRHDSRTSVARDATIQQAATLAASLAARPDAWPTFRQQLHAAGGDDPKTLVLAAIALGWKAKWRAS